QEGHVQIAKSLPYRIEIAMPGRFVADRHPRNPKRPAPQAYALAHLGHAARGVKQGSLPRRDEPWILAAKGGHCAVVRADAAIAHVQIVVMQVLSGGKSREHQLALEAE